MFFLFNLCGKNPECKEINGTTFPDAPLDLLSSLACNFLVHFGSAKMYLYILYRYICIYTKCIFVSISKRPVSPAAYIRMIISCLGLDSNRRVTYHIMETIPPYLIVLQSNCVYLFIDLWNPVCNFMKNQFYMSISLKWFWDFTGNIFAQIWQWELQEAHIGGGGHCGFSFNIAKLQSFLCTKAMVLGLCWVEG